MDPALLPIHEIRPALADTLAAGVRRFVLEAPTGSGKSTQVPKMLASFTGKSAVPGRIVILEPRRVAARMLAKRVAWELGEKPGGTVGHQIRFEKCWGPSTRIVFVTEGVLLRWMLDDPALSGVGAILFDEFHERHLYGDVSLAMALSLQKGARPDLVIGVMSATLNGDLLKSYLAPAANLVSQGRMFPVDVTYAGGAGANVREEEPVWEKAARACSEAVEGMPEGDVLIFMPGAYEIRRTIEEISSRGFARGFDLLPLHGELPPEAQDAAVEPSGRRKIVVATNLAETSLTIDGVRCVIDSGLAKIPSHDPARGINTILIQKISRASADQRAGRAGRTAPGTCIRLWSKGDQERRAAREEPEVRRLDLSEILLFLKSAGVGEPRAFPWLEAPEEDALAHAETLLRDLGALDGEGRLTATGRRMSAFPLHPRYARMLLAGEEFGCGESAALVAALSQDKSLLLRLENRAEREAREDFFARIVPHPELSDFFMDAAALSAAARERFDLGFCRKWGIHAMGARAAGRLFEQLLGAARGAGLSGRDSYTGEALFTALRKAILAGFSDQLAKRDGVAARRYSLVHNRSGELRKDSPVEAPLLVAAEIEERNLRGDVGVTLARATAVEEAWLEELFPGEVAQVRAPEFDPTQRCVLLKLRRTFRNLVLEERTCGEPTADEAAPLLAAEVVAGRLVLKEWGEAEERWIARVNFVAKHFPEYGVAPIGEEERKLIAAEVCYGAIGYKEVKDRPVMGHLKGWLGAGQEALLEKCAPERVDLPRQKTARLRYEADGKVYLSATVQQLYDAPGKLLLGGRVPVIYEILAPSRRPVQVTSDLNAFWSGVYEEVKKQLKGRYPRHEWR